MASARPADCAPATVGAESRRMAISVRQCGRRCGRGMVMQASRGGSCGSAKMWREWRDRQKGSENVDDAEWWTSTATAEKRIGRIELMTTDPLRVVTAFAAS